MKRLILIITTLLLIIATLASAQNIEDSYDFLRKQELTTVFEASLAALALNNIDTTSAQPIIQWIQEQQDLTQGCFPEGDCTVKDTALAIIALTYQGWDTTDAEQWLLEQQQPSTAGNTYLQVITSETGTCSIEYKSEDSETWQSKEIDVEEGLISSASCPTKSTFFNLGTCLESGLLGTNPSLQTKVLCRDLGDAKISIIYKESNAYYLVYNSLSNTVEDLTLNTGSFGSYEDTLYANWALTKLGSNTNSVTWLKAQFSPGNVRDNALVYVITEQQAYIYNLITLQNKNTGSFESSAFKTGLACLAFTESGTYGTEAEQSRKWLDSRQLEEGSWNNNIADTAMALYGCYSNEAVNLPPCEDDDCYPSIIISPVTRTTDTYTITTCIDDTDCPINEKCIDGICQVETLSICNFDGFCDLGLGEDKFNCPTDCEDEDEFDDSTVVYDDTGFVDEEIEEEGGSFWIVVIILLLLLILAAAYYFFILKQGKSLRNILFKRKRKTVRPPIRTPAYGRPPPRQVRRPTYKPTKKRPTKIESELKKSLEEAKKLLKK